MRNLLAACRSGGEAFVAKVHAVRQQAIYAGVFVRSDDNKESSNDT